MYTAAAAAAAAATAADAAAKARRLYQRQQPISKRLIHAMDKYLLEGGIQKAGWDYATLRLCYLDALR